MTSQTSSLHTALSELAGDVEVVDMEDGALTNDRYSSHNDYQGTYFLVNIVVVDLSIGANFFLFSNRTRPFLVFSLI